MILKNFLFYDLVRCLPFPDFVLEHEYNVGEYFIIQSNQHQQTRNEVGGVCGT